jgi:hypothetical protein
MSKEIDYFIMNKSLSKNSLMCQKCKEIASQIESHHVWCKFMDNPHGYTFKEGQPNRYDLCFDCHKKLHQEIIIPLLNSHARTLKKNGSEFWLWKQIAQIDKPKVILDITENTIKWVTGNDSI